MEMLILGGRVIDPARGLDETLDIRIADGRIAAIGRFETEGGTDEHRIDARGCVVAPGLIDTHVHFRDPGFTHKEDLETGAAAAQRGGFTTVVCMANTKPVVDNPATLADILARGARTGIHILQASSVTRGMAGEELVDMTAMRDAGAAGFTDDGLPILRTALLREAMTRAAALGRPISLHEEDPTLIAQNGIHAEIAERMGLRGAPAVAEDLLVARDCALALDTGARVVVQHISSGRAVEIVRFARARGADVWAEATPHHFSLTQKALLEHGTSAKMNPPLRTEWDRMRIVEGLADGAIALIASDHAPHTAAEKAMPLDKAPSGIIGLETSLALGVTNLVRKGHLTLPALLEKMTAAPAAAYRLPYGTLAPGAPADLVVFDPDEEWTVSSFASKSANSPFAGQRLFGRVRHTVCGGSVVYSAGAAPTRMS